MDDSFYKSNLGLFEDAADGVIEQELARRRLRKYRSTLILMTAGALLCTIVGIVLYYLS